MPDAEELCRRILQVEPGNVEALWFLGYVCQNLGNLETQMVNWVPEETSKSPDRIDALVYALLWLTSRVKMFATTASPARAPLPGRTSLGPLGARLPGYPG